MNPPPDLPDPLLKSLVDEASHLPGLAAREARRARVRRIQHRRHLGRLLAIVVLGLCSWQTFRLVRPVWKAAGSPPDPVQQTAASTAARPGEFVRVQTTQEAMSEPLPIPPGVSKEQKELLEAARGLPLLLVMDDSGKVTHIHIIER